MSHSSSESSSPATSSQVADVSQNGNKARHLMSFLGPFISLAAVILFFGVADEIWSEKPSFLTIESFRLISVISATIAVAALGMTIIIIAGGIDLSVGTGLALCATVLAWSLQEDLALKLAHGRSNAELKDYQKEISKAEKDLKRTEDRVARYQKALADKESSTTRTRLEESQQKLETLQQTIHQNQEKYNALLPLTKKWSRWTPLLAVLLAIATGCLAGFCNGLLTSCLRVVPFIVTLGMMRVYLGMAKKIGKETTIRPDLDLQVPEWLERFLSTRKEALYPHFVSGNESLDGWLEMFRFPLGVWLAMVLAILLILFLRYSVFSRHIFALGSNESTAKLCGINVKKSKIVVYTLGGLFMGIAGLYQFSRLSVGNPTSGIGMELEVIAAVVIGGGSLNGGRGSVLGTITGAIIMVVITQGCGALEVKNSIQDIILGGIIIAAVTVDGLRSRKQHS